jgi:hypothetical protein
MLFHDRRYLYSLTNPVEDSLTMQLIVLLNPTSSDLSTEWPERHRFGQRNT